MANKVLAEIGVIGGTGLYAMKELKIIREIKIKTPFGNPSDNIILGTLSGIKVAFLAHPPARRRDNKPRNERNRQARGASIADAKCNEITPEGRNPQRGRAPHRA